MVLILNGSSEIGAHAWSEIGKLISLRISFARQQAQKISFLRIKTVF